MLKKKKWIIISVLTAAIVVAMGVMGVSAYAKSGNSTNPAGLAAQAADNTTTNRKVDQQKVLADKVAAILGLDSSTVEAAFEQAQKEINSENAAEKLKAEEARIDQMVTDGKMTAEEGAQLKAWLESKPNIEIPGMGLRGGFGGGPSGRNGFGNRGMLPPGSDAAADPGTTDATGTN